MLLGAVALVMACAAVTTGRGVVFDDSITAPSYLLQVVELHRVDIATWSIVWLVALLVSHFSSHTSSRNATKSLTITTTGDIQTVEYKEPGSPSIVVRTPCGLRSSLKGSRKRFFEDSQRSGVSFSEQIRPPGISTVKDSQANELSEWKGKCSELKKGTAKNTKDLLLEKKIAAELDEERREIKNNSMKAKEEHMLAMTSATNRKKACDASKLKEKTHEMLIKSTANDVDKLKKDIKKQKELLIELTNSCSSLEASIQAKEQQAADDDQLLRQSNITIFQNKLRIESLAKTGTRLREQLTRVKKVQEALSKENADGDGEKETE